MSLRESNEREGVEVKRGRPLGPTSREGSLSSAARRRERAWTEAMSASDSTACSSEADFLPSALDLGLLALVKVDLVFLDVE